jgi:hypothetical protein
MTAQQPALKAATRPKRAAWQLQPDHCTKRFSHQLAHRAAVLLAVVPCTAADSVYAMRCSKDVKTAMRIATRLLQTYIVRLHMHQFSSKKPAAVDNLGFQSCTCACTC